MNGIFITGTDTGVGKTLICGYLAGYLRRQGVRVITQKWVQTGCADIAEDLALHQRLGGIETPPEPAALLNPYCYRFPASPHLAAAREGRRIDPEVIAGAYQQLAARYELVLVEGAGGLLVPLSEDLLTVDLVARLGLAALVVVRNGLGCINHTLLTIEALRGRNIPLAGLIFNRVREAGEDAEILRDNPRIIAALSGIEPLGEFPYLADPLQGAAAFAPIGQAFQERLFLVPCFPFLG